MPFVLAILVFVAVTLAAFAVISLFDERTARARTLRDRLSNVDKAADQPQPEAELLRDMWLVGPVVSTVLWPVTKLFEYKVTGSLGDPKAEPVSPISKVMLLPFQLTFHPLRTLKSILPEDLTSSRTNAPPLNSPR